MRKTPDIDMCIDVHICNTHTHTHIHAHINAHTEAEYKNVSLASILFRLEDSLLINVFTENTDIYSISAQE